MLGDRDGEQVFKEAGSAYRRCWMLDTHIDLRNYARNRAFRCENSNGHRQLRNDQISQDPDAKAHLKLIAERDPTSYRPSRSTRRVIHQIRR